MESTNRLKNWVIILPFCICILVPTLDNIFSFLPKVNLKENRKLAESPKVDFAHLDKFPNEFNTYFNDNFSMRGIMTKLHRKLYAELFRVSSVWNVLIGEDNWLFQSTVNYLEIYKRKTLFSINELEVLGKEFQFRKEFIEQNGGKMYIVFAPTKNQIYPEKLPRYLLKKNGINKTEQLSEYLRKDIGVDVIELHSAFHDAKKNNEEVLYYKGDTHWTHFGAMTGAVEISKYLQKDFPVIPDLKMSDFETFYKEKVGGNLASIIDYREKVAMPILNFKYKDESRFRDSVVETYPIPKDFAYKKDYEITTETINSELPKILCISDSYGGYIQPFLSPLFSRSVFIFDKWEFKLNEPIVKNEKADVVLFLLMEGHINNLLKNHSLPDS